MLRKLFSFLIGCNHNWKPYREFVVERTWPNIAETGRIYINRCEKCGKLNQIKIRMV
jgi:hypothetical protein